MKLIFQDSKTKQFATLEIDAKATIEEVRDELQSKHNFAKGDYKFIHLGAILKNPTPFSSLEENSKVIVYISTPKPQSPPPQPSQPTAQENQRAQQAQSNQSRQASQEEALRIITPILRSAMSVNLVEKLYQPENDFYNHPREAYEISQLIDETSSGLISEFIIRHFQTTMRSFNLTTDVILSMIGHDLPDVRRITSDYDATLMELTTAQRNIVKKYKEKYDKVDPQIILDTCIACEFNENNISDCLDQG